MVRITILACVASLIGLGIPAAFAADDLQVKAIDGNSTTISFRKSSGLGISHACARGKWAIEDHRLTTDECVNHTLIAQCERWKRQNDSEWPYLSTNCNSRASMQRLLTMSHYMVTETSDDRVEVTTFPQLIGGALLPRQREQRTAVTPTPKKTPAAPGSTTFRVTGADASVTGGGPVSVSRTMTMTAEEIANGIDEAVAKAVADERERLGKEFTDNTAALRADLSAANTWLWRLGIWAVVATVLLILVAGLLIGCFWCRKHPKKTTVVSQQPPRSNGNGPPRTATEPVAPAPTPASPAAEDRKETAPKADPGKQNLLLRIRGMLPGKKDEEAKTTTASASDTELKGATHDSDQNKAEQKPCVSVAGLAAFVSSVPIGADATPAASTKVESAQPREEAAVQSTDGDTSATEKPCDIGKFLRNNRHGSHLNGSSREQGAKRCNDSGLSKSLVRLNGSNVDPGSIAENQVATGVAAGQDEDLIYEVPKIYDDQQDPVPLEDLMLLADPRCVFDPWTPSFVRNRTNGKCGAYFPPGSLDAGKPKHGFLVWLVASTEKTVAFPNRIGITLDPEDGKSILAAERKLFGEGKEPRISPAHMVRLLERYRSTP